MRLCLMPRGSFRVWERSSQGSGGGVSRDAGRSLTLCKYVSNILLTFITKTAPLQRGRIEESGMAAMIKANPMAELPNRQPLLP